MGLEGERVPEISSGEDTRYLDPSTAAIHMTKAQSTARIEAMGLSLLVETKREGSEGRGKKQSISKMVSDVLGASHSWLYALNKLLRSVLPLQAIASLPSLLPLPSASSPCRDSLYLVSTDMAIQAPA